MQIKGETAQSCVNKKNKKKKEKYDLNAYSTLV